MEKITFNLENSSSKDLQHKIQEAFHGFLYLNALRGRKIQEVKKMIQKFPFGSLEENISRKHHLDLEEIKKELIKNYPELIKKYDKLILRLKNQDLNYEEFEKILDEADSLLAQFDKTK